MLSCCIQAIDCRQPHARVGVPRPSMCMLRSEPIQKASRRPSPSSSPCSPRSRRATAPPSRASVAQPAQALPLHSAPPLGAPLGSWPGSGPPCPSWCPSCHSRWLCPSWAVARHEGARWDVSASYAHRRAQPRARFAVGRAPLAPCRTAPFARLPSRRRFGRCPACSCI